MIKFKTFKDGPLLDLHSKLSLFFFTNPSAKYIDVKYTSIYKPNASPSRSQIINSALLIYEVEPSLIFEELMQKVTSEMDEFKGANTKTGRISTKKPNKSNVAKTLEKVKE